MGARSLTIFVRVLEHRGLAIEELATAAGVPVATLRTSGMVQYDDGMALWRAAESLTGDACVGLHAGAAIELDQVGMFGPVVAHASDVRGGLAALCRIFAMAVEGGRLTLDGDRLVYVSPRPEGPTLRHGVDAIFASVLKIVRSCAAGEVRVRAVSHQLPRPDDVRPYRRVYGVSPTFGAAENAIELAPESLSLPMRGSDPVLARLVLTHAEQLVGDAAPAPVVRDAEAALSALLQEGREPTLVEVAARVGTSGRSLQRAFGAAGTSFSAVRAGVLREHAERWLREAVLSIDEIAARLGYVHRSGFERAFRAWTGRTPAQARSTRG